MSKFDYEIFIGDYNEIAVSKEKYTKEQAIEIAKREIVDDFKYLAVGNCFCRHRAGINEDGEPCVGWWLEYREEKRSCPCWAFHTSNTTKKGFYEDYEFIDLSEETK